MMYLASREGRDDLYPTELGRRAMTDSANFYTMSMLYPLVARRTVASVHPEEQSAIDATRS